MKTAKEHFKNRFYPKKITVISKDTAIELMESYAKETAIEFSLDSMGYNLDKDLKTEREIVNKRFDEFIDEKAKAKDTN